MPPLCNGTSTFASRSPRTRSRRSRCTLQRCTRSIWALRPTRRPSRCCSAASDPTAGPRSLPPLHTRCTHPASRGHVPHTGRAAHSGPQRRQRRRALARLHARLILMAARTKEIELRFNDQRKHTYSCLLSWYFPIRPSLAPATLPPQNTSLFKYS
jgi:hypothetical protein